MKRLSAFIFLSSLFLSAFSQGKVLDAASGEPLSSASIILFSSGKKTGLVANKEGIFSFTSSVDSIRASMVGYRSKTVFAKEFINKNYFEVKLETVPAELSEVIVKKTTALDIIKKTIAAIPSIQPKVSFENKGFYREIIKDKENYFSVSEAVFAAQYYPSKGSYKLKLIQGRSKEDVAYTRLFEDYHPGGGPQSAISKSLLLETPDFLDIKKIKYFNYKIDSLVQFDDRWLYSISFDQKPDVKQALEKGSLLIDADEFAVVKYEATNSPKGTPYIKDLTGSDKFFAALLNIDFKRKSWKHRVDFTKVDDKWILSYVESERKIGYKQEKKNIDLDLTVNSEILFTDLVSPVTTPIIADEEWKRKNLVSNLPSVFDPGFWGNNNIISPTEQVKSIVDAISKNNNENSIAGKQVNDPIAIGWQLMNRNLFVSFQNEDTITLIPIMKCWWEDEKSGGMLFKEMKRDFSFETKINITKSDNTEMPDKGFQQAGIIIRKKDDQKENYIFLSIGTGGNPTPKISFKKTADSKSKTFAEKMENMNGWLRLEKKGNKLIGLYRSVTDNEYKKIGEYTNDWLNTEIQIGLAAYAGFPGDGPKMKPDMKAEFTGIRIEMK
ncbi:MAG TPA: carboxypeptidase-like regulatory domain-containing protein [Chitinophagaceae bacterium]|nr:carboxypeptidase-like regulatory domain-containing protein [Chitinophagaceae bacterium]